MLCAQSAPEVLTVLYQWDKRYLIKTNISWHFCGLKLFFVKKKLNLLAKNLAKSYCTGQPQDIIVLIIIIMAKVSLLLHF